MNQGRKKRSGIGIPGLANRGLRGGKENSSEHQGRIADRRSSNSDARPIAGNGQDMEKKPSRFIRKWTEKWPNLMHEMWFEDGQGR